MSIILLKLGGTCGTLCLLGYNVCVADTADEAQFLRSSSVLSFLSLRKGQPRRLPPPVRNLTEQLEPLDRAILAQMNSPTAIGTLDDVASGMGQFIEGTGVDELMLVCSIYQHAKRVQSFEIVAEAARQLDLVAA